MVAFVLFFFPGKEVHAFQINNTPDQGEHRASELAELRDFTRHIHQFSYLLMTGDFAQAEWVKNEIIRLMDEEIRQKYKQLDIPTPSDASRSASRRYGVSELNLNPEGMRILNRLQLQEQLRDRFLRTDLEAGRRAGKQERRHREVVYEFRSIMMEELGLTNGDPNRVSRSVRW